MTHLTGEPEYSFLYGLTKANAKKPNHAQIGPAEAVAHFHILRSREVGEKSYRKKVVAADKASYSLEQFCLFVPAKESIRSTAVNHCGNKSTFGKLDFFLCF